MSTSIPKRRGETRILVFNPSDFPDTPSAFGIFYHFKAQGVGTCQCQQHNIPGAVDNVGCHAAYEHERDDRGRLILDRPLGVANEGKATAENVAQLLVSEESRGAKGFVILEGTPAEQEEQKREARNTWTGFYAEEVEQGIADWELFVSNVRANSPGAQAPKRTAKVAQYYAWRARNRAQLEQEPRAEFVCNICGFDTSIAQEHADHQAEEHPGLSAVAPPPPTAPPPAPRADPSVPVGASDVDLREGKKLIIRAETAGMQLSVADKKGLAHGDPDVLQDVTARLDTIKMLVKGRRAGTPQPEGTDQGASTEAGVTA